MNPPISVDYATLKASVRQGLTTEGREYWWPILSSIDDQKFAMREYPDVSGSAERLLAMSSSASPIASPTRNNSTDNKVLVTTPKLTSNQEMKYNLLLETLATAKSVGECPLLISGFLQIISEVIPRSDICHLICRDVIESTQRRLPTRPGEYLCKLHVFRVILQRFMPKTFEALSLIQGLTNKYLNLIFMDFFKTLLPKVTVLRVMDAYLLEGDKVLIRYGLALIRKHRKSLKSGLYLTGLSFWQAVQNNALNEGIFEIYSKNRRHFERRTELPCNIEVTEDEVKADFLKKNIHLDAFDNSRGTFQKIMKPMRVSRSRLAEVAEGFPMEQTSLKAPFFPSLGSGFGPDGDSSQTLFPSAESTTVAQAIASKSTILTNDTAARLLAMCCPLIRSLDPVPFPIPVTIDQGLYPIFSTAEHGFSLSSLYSRIQGISPIVILIKGIKEDDAPQYVIGLYLSEPFESPSKNIIGNGETFLFTLSNSRKKSNLARKFSWAKSKVRNASSDLYTVEPCAAIASVLPCEGAMTQFAVFSPNYMSFGASEEHSTNAIRVDSSMSVCNCGPSDTFGNSTHSILSTGQHSQRPTDLREEVRVKETTDAGFKIESVEVFTDRYSSESR